MQTSAGTFPCQTMLHKWGRSASPHSRCLLCRGEALAEKISHIQCRCPALREARIAAPHALAAMIFTAFQARSAGRWQCHIEIAVSSLRAIQAPLDLLDMWNRMVDALEEPDANNTDGIITEGELPQDLSRLRPDR